jgi:hypothetical protein
MKLTYVVVAPFALALLAVSAAGVARPSAPSSPALAGQPAHDQASTQAPSFASLDTKKHGYLQRDDLPKNNESLAKLRAHFAEADVNQDGNLSQAEYYAYVHPADPEASLVRGESPKGNPSPFGSQ